MRGELKRLQRDLGISFVHVTHSQDEAMALADCSGLMEAATSGSGSGAGHFRKTRAPLPCSFHRRTQHRRDAGRSGRGAGRPVPSGSAGDQPGLSAVSAMSSISGRRCAFPWWGRCDAAALISDEVFRPPVDIGQDVAVVWSENDARALSATRFERALRAFDAPEIVFGFDLGAEPIEEGAHGAPFLAALPDDIIAQWSQ